MPVQFIGSSGGGGGVTDIRDILTAPVLNDVLVNSTGIVVKHQIPANYLLSNNMLSLRSIFQVPDLVGGDSTRNISFTLRIGTTGTTADTVIKTASFVSAFYSASLSPKYYAKIEIAFPTIGSSGTCVTYGKMHENRANQGTTTQSFSNPNNTTVNTTVPLYITISATVAGTTFTLDTLGSYLGIGY